MTPEEARRRFTMAAALLVTDRNGDPVLTNAQLHKLADLAELLAMERMDRTND